MKIGTTKERFLNAILLSERIVGKKESLPVLSCILIDATKELSISATNLEAGINITIPVEIEEPGTVAVNAHVLAQTIRSISGDKITLRTEDNNLLIESRGTKTLIKAVAHNEFPALASKIQSKGIIVSRDLLMRGIQSVSYSASPSMIRPELGSVYIAMSDTQMITVATDSFRLAEKIVANSGGTRADNAQDLLIPLRHALELTHVL